MTFVPRLIGDPGQELVGQKQPALPDLMPRNSTNPGPRLDRVLMQVKQRSGVA